jgi:hypothetical protein
LSKELEPLPLSFVPSEELERFLVPSEDCEELPVVLSFTVRIISEDRLLVLGVSEDLERAGRSIATSDDTAFGLRIAGARRPLGRSEDPERLSFLSPSSEALDLTKVLSLPLASSVEFKFPVSDGRRVPLLFRRSADRGRGVLVVLLCRGLEENLPFRLRSVEALLAALEVGP